MHELVTDESFRSALFCRKLCASVVEVGMPKGLSVDFNAIEEWRGVLSILGVNDIENELSQLVQEIE